MKRTFLLSFIVAFSIVAFSAFLVVACGGGGGGSGDEGGEPKVLSADGFTKTVAPGTDSSWTAPFDDSSTDREQHLYLSGDIDGSGYIEALSFRYQDHVAAGFNCPDVTIKMGHTSLSSLTTTFANNVEVGRGSLETVLSGAISGPAGSAGDYFTIPLDTQFHYNGVDNLVVEILRAEACDGGITLEATNTVYTDVSLHNFGTTSPAGALFDEILNTRFKFTGGDNAQVLGSSAYNNFPFSTMNRRIQNLYLASEIDGSGSVTGLAFKLNAASTEGTYTYSVTMGHTTLSTLGSTYADNYNAGSPIIMADSATFTIPADLTAGEWFWVPLPDAAFTYNGTDNLIIEVGVTAATATNAILVGNAADRRAYGPVENDTSDGVDDRPANIKLRFNGGTMDVITDGGVTGYYPPFGWPFDEFIMQTLYDNTALGTSGQFTELGVRLGFDSTAFDHGDINLVLGHTTRSSLGSTLSLNIESDLTVAFSGTISIPVGLEAGDWVRIPLSTPFQYDATKNLVVQWDGPANLSGIGFLGHTSTTGKYVGHLRHHYGDRTSDIGNTTYDLLTDMSLTIEK
jgi:hypothetical protein